MVASSINLAHCFLVTVCANCSVTCILHVFDNDLYYFNKIRKIPIKNEEEPDEGHPPGENDEANSDEQSESVRES